MDLEAQTGTWLLHRGKWIHHSDWDRIRQPNGLRPGENIYGAARRVLKRTIAEVAAPAAGAVIAYAGGSVNEHFKAKRSRANRNSGVCALVSAPPAEAMQIDRGNSIIKKNMRYGRRRGRRRTFRRRGGYIKKTRKRMAKRGFKRKGSWKARKAISNIRHALDAVPLKTFAYFNTQAFPGAATGPGTGTALVSATINKQGVLWGAGLGTESQYYDAFNNAVDVQGTKFINYVGGATHVYQMKASCVSKISNLTSRTVYVQPIYMWCKKDLNEATVSNVTVRSSPSQVMMDLIGLGLGYEEQTTAFTKYPPIQGANYYSYGAILMKDGDPVLNSLVFDFFKVKKGQKVALGPGAEFTAKMRTKKIKRIPPGSTALGNNITPSFSRGRSKCILWLVSASLSGNDIVHDTAGAGATYIGTWQVGIAQYEHHAMKIMNRDTTAYYSIDDRPGLSGNERCINSNNNVKEAPVYIAT